MFIVSGELVACRNPIPALTFFPGLIPNPGARCGHETLSRDSPSTSTHAESGGQGGYVHPETSEKTQHLLKTHSESVLMPIGTSKPFTSLSRNLAPRSRIRYILVFPDSLDFETHLTLS